jgi:hypothetical protein
MASKMGVLIHESRREEYKGDLKEVYEFLEGIENEVGNQNKSLAVSVMGLL